MRWVFALALVAGCSKGPEDPRADLVAKWKEGGITVGAMEPAQAGFGADCKQTTVKALEVLLCTYQSPEAAKAAEDPALTWIGEATGAAKASGKVLVAVVDRRKTDPSGKTINQLMKLTPK
ncbi:MAG TPA: hypothetical protein VGM90_35380 [Kofleriaceae bacterium]|jgi:hypothetical protein